MKSTDSKLTIRSVEAIQVAAAHFASTYTTPHAHEFSASSTPKTMCQ